MFCERCLNTEESYFYTYQGKTYCRKCITFGRNINTKLQLVRKNVQASYSLSYQLTKSQENIASVLLTRYQEGLDTKLKAVCGAGKTEILYDVIQYALQLGHRVCFAIPRRELVKELAERVQSQFQYLSCSVVYGGNTKDLDGQLVICTCHQLYRYVRCFDLLIVDEADAFPYKGDPVLQNIVERSCKGHTIFMSATMATNEANINLHTRYHGFPLPVPSFRKLGFASSILLIITQVRKYYRAKKPVLIYVANIETTYQVQRYFKYVGLNLAIAHSKCDSIQEHIRQLKQGEIAGIVTTTLLERGITIANVQVLVLEVENRIYDTDTLLQISGRVGRNMKYPTGDIWFYGVYQTKAVKQCIKTIRKDNAYCV